MPKIRVRIICFASALLVVWVLIIPWLVFPRKSRRRPVEYIARYSGLVVVNVAPPRGIKASRFSVNLTKELGLEKHERNSVRTAHKVLPQGMPDPWKKDGDVVVGEDSLGENMLLVLDAGKPVQPTAIQVAVAYMSPRAGNKIRMWAQMDYIDGDVAGSVQTAALTVCLEGDANSSGTWITYMPDATWDKGRIDLCHIQIGMADGGAGFKVSVRQNGGA